MGTAPGAARGTGTKGTGPKGNPGGKGKTAGSATGKTKSGKKVFPENPDDFLPGVKPKMKGGPKNYREWTVEEYLIKYHPKGSHAYWPEKPGHYHVLKNSTRSTGGKDQWHIPNPRFGPRGIDRKWATFFPGDTIPEQILGLADSTSKCNTWFDAA